MKRFVLSPDAAEDLDDIWEYVAADSLEAADRLIGEIYNQILALASTPGMGHRREDLAEDRPLLFWSAEVVAAAHGKRDIPSFIRRRGI